MWTFYRSCKQNTVSLVLLGLGSSCRKKVFLLFTARCFSRTERVIWKTTAYNNMWQWACIYRAKCIRWLGKNSFRFWKLIRRTACLWAFFLAMDICVEPQGPNILSSSLKHRTACFFWSFFGRCGVHLTVIFCRWRSGWRWLCRIPTISRRRLNLGRVSNRVFATALLLREADESVPDSYWTASPVAIFCVDFPTSVMLTPQKLFDVKQKTPRKHLSNLRKYLWDCFRVWTS